MAQKEKQMIMLNLIDFFIGCKMYDYSKVKYNISEVWYLTVQCD